MGRFVEGANRNQAALLPECLGDFIAEDNPVRIVDAFVDELDLASMGFEWQQIQGGEQSRQQRHSQQDRKAPGTDRAKHQRSLDALETADRTRPTKVEAKTERLRQKIETLREHSRANTQELRCTRTGTTVTTAPFRYPPLGL